MKSDKSRATYRNGVLKIELPKVAPDKPSVTQADPRRLTPGKTLGALHRAYQSTA